MKNRTGFISQSNNYNYNKLKFHTVRFSSLKNKHVRMSGSQDKSWGSKFSFCLWGRMIEITGARYSVKNARICDFHATTLVAVEWQTDCDQCVHLHGHNTSPTTSHTCRSLPSRVFPLPCQNPPPWFFFCGLWQFLFHQLLKYCYSPKSLLLFHFNDYSQEKSLPNLSLGCP